VRAKGKKWATGERDGFGCGESARESSRNLTAARRGLLLATQKVSRRFLGPRTL